MRVLLAQIFFRMRREIDDDQASRRFQRARRLAQRARGIVEIVQHLMQDRQIAGIALDRQRIDVALPQLRIAHARAVEIGARDRQHGRRQIDADCAIGKGAEKFEHPARAGAAIEQLLNLQVAGDLAHSALHIGLGRMHLAQLVPGLRVGREIARGMFGALLADFGETFAVGGQRAIIGVEPRGDLAHDFGAGATLRRQKERPGAFAVALGEARFHQQLQMARHARLRLAENRDQLGNRQFGLGDQRENAQPRLLAGRRQGGKGGVERDLRGFGGQRHGSGTTERYKDIFIRIHARIASASASFEGPRWTSGFG